MTSQNSRHSVPEESAALVVMEERSAWPARPLSGVYPVAVVAEHGDQTPSILHRVARRAKEFATEGVPLRRAVLSCASAIDAAALRKRIRIAQALLAVLVASGGGALVLTASDTDPAARDALANLARSLDAGVKGSGVSIEIDGDGVDTSERA